MKYFLLILLLAACGDPAFGDDCEVKCEIGQTICSAQSSNAVLCIPRDDSECNKFEAVHCPDCKTDGDQCFDVAPAVCDESCATRPAFDDYTKTALRVSCTAIDGFDYDVQILELDESCRGDR